MIIAAEQICSICWMSGMKKKTHLSRRMLCVAEGIETDSQIELLKALGCDRLQGYLIGKPMPAEDFFHQFGESTLRKK